MNWKLFWGMFIGGILLTGSFACGPSPSPKKLKTTLQSEQDDPFVNHTRGVMLLHQKEYSSAAGYLKRAAEEEPDNAAYWNDFGLAMSFMGEFDAAEQAFQKALKLHPELTDAHNNLGMVYTEEGKLDKALEEYGKVIQDKTYPTPYFPYFNIGLLKLKQGQKDAAEMAFEQAIKLKPDFYRAYAELAALYAAKGQYGDAYNAVKKAEKQYTDEPGLLLLEAQCQYHLKNYNDSRRILTKLSLLYPDQRIREGMDKLKKELTKKMILGE
ncbi:MAG: tetratricopeptide repeat protein [Acidobacteria bacterium]|nr:tetratricopeptide repeat protein [Acidobacteriota bacterium]